MTTACASQQPFTAHTFAGAKTRDDFIIMAINQAPNGSAIGAKEKACIADETERVLPPRFLAAIDTYVGDKSAANWSAVVAEDKSVDWNALNPQADRIAQVCKSKHGV
jgi:hypothetical protein